LSSSEPRIRLNELLPLVYEQLRGYASKVLQDEPSGLTLQTTDLVHEVYLRLSELKEIQWSSDGHLMRASVGVMRRVLVDHARARRAAKRQAPGVRTAINDSSDVPQNDENSDYSVIDIMDLDDALQRLSEFDQRKVEVVEMRYFGGLQIPEIAKILDISPATVKRDWQLAKAWLFREIQRSDGRDRDESHKE
jgi:RNA polymerase sigma-70 factor (ECF subfamily)